MQQIMGIHAVLSEKGGWWTGNRKLIWNGHSYIYHSCRQLNLLGDMELIFMFPCFGHNNAFGYSPNMNIHKPSNGPTIVFL